MLLPRGKTCKDCVRFQRGEWLISLKGNETNCDWSPSKFIDIKTVEVQENWIKIVEDISNMKYMLKVN